MIDTRAASEVIGFILIFSLIATTTGIVYTVGFSGLEDSRDAERLRNAERAFDVLADNIDDVTRRGAPARATEVKVADATLSTGEPTRIEVSAGSTYLVETRPVMFRISSGDAAIAYEAGAVVRSDGDASVFKRTPGFVIDKQQTVLTVPQLESSSSDGVGGSTTALVRTERIGSSVLADETPSSPITIRVETTTTRAEAWNRYLEAEIREGFPAITASDDPCSITGGGTVVECTHPNLEPDRLLVTATRMGVTVE